MVRMTAVREEGFTQADIDALPHLPGASYELEAGMLLITRPGGLTLADRDALPLIMSAKQELLDGVVYVSPGPSNRHEGVLGNLYLLIRAAADRDVRVRFSRFDVTLREQATFEPDVVVATTDVITDSGIVGTPLLAVEILSPSTRRHDLVRKRAELEAAGCPSYWIIDPGRGATGPTLTVLELLDGAYAEVAVVSGRESWTATRPFAVTVVPDDLVDD